MKNLMNHVDTIRDESLDGFAAAHADIVALGPDREYIRRKNIRQGKVALISGGGGRSRAVAHRFRRIRYA